MLNFPAGSLPNLGMSHYLEVNGNSAVADPGFPVRGVDPLGGRVDPLGRHGPPMWAHFGENVCKNKRIVK